MELDQLRANLMNRACWNVGAISANEFDDALGSDDDLFCILAATQRDAMIDHISRTRQLNREIVDKLVSRDLTAWSAAVKNGKARRWESARAKVNSRFEVYSKNHRVMESLCALTPDRTGYLDVGCGFGFTMLSAESLGFRKAHGMEIDQAFATTGLSLMPEGFDGELGYAYGDFLELHCRPPYSLVTFFDVLEHIGDARRALEKAQSFLTEDGAIYLYQGNYKSPQMVSLEPHYRVPLITLMPRDIAIRVLGKMGKIANEHEYVVNKWPELAIFDGLETTATLIDDGHTNFRSGQPNMSDATGEAIVKRLPRMLETELAPYLEDTELDHMRDIISKYQAQYELDRIADKDRHRIEWLMPSWNILLSKSGELTAGKDRMILYSGTHLASSNA